MSYAASYKRVISDLYNSTSWLHSYCIINKIATQKLLRKASNTLESIKAMEIYLELEAINDNLDYFGDLAPINDLRKKIVKFYANEFKHGNEANAKNELESRMRGNKTKESFCLGIYLGMIGCLIFSLILISFFGKNLININVH